MADLLARFKLVDEMSDRLGNIAESGQRMLNQWQQAGDATNAALDGISGSAVTVASTVDGVATSVDSLQGAMGNAASSSEVFADSAGNFGSAAADAASQADYWTAAIGDYDRSALEAVYSTEELVEMGLKSADALKEQERMIDLCERSATNLSRAVEATSDAQNELSKTMEQASRVASELADSENVSAEAKDELERASTAAVEAVEQLTTAQEEAAAAMRHYDNVMASGTSDLGQLEEAAEGAQHAAENLAAANGRASEATEELSRATENAAEEAENAERTSQDAIEGIAQALGAAGIIVMVKEVAAAVYEMADSFSEAEKIVRVSTGATGQELGSLMQSAQNIYANSNAESLEEIAVGMTSIANATNLAGKELEETTDKGYALQDLFGYEMSESARTASTMMKTFSVTAAEAYDIMAAGAQNGADKNGDMMDVLNEYSAHYAALGLSADEFVTSLVDGASAGVFSVDKVGDAVKEFNIRAKDGSESSAEAFELLGMNADVMTAKFAAGGDVASEAFFGVVQALEGMDDPVQKNAAAVGLFGTMYEDLEATILPVLSGIKSGTLDTADALSKSAEGSQSMSDGWQEAGNSIKTAFSTAISPTIEKASSALSGIVKGFGDFLNEYPVATKAITAIGIGLGVTTVGIAGVAFATSSAIPAIVSFGVALNAALGPIGWVALAIGGVTAAVAAFIAMSADANDETAGLTAASREQYYELQDLNAEYEEACTKYGETSEEASRLKYQVDDLSTAYEASRQTVEEFTAEVDELVRSHNELISSYEDSMTEIKNNELGAYALIQKLEDLVEQNEKTVASEEQIKAIIDQLNTDLPELALSYEDVTTNAEAAVDAMKAAAQIQAEDERKVERQQQYVDLLKEQAALEDEITKAEANLNAEREAHGMYFDEYTQAWTNNGYTEDSLWASWTTDLDEYGDAMDLLNTAYSENKAQLAEIESEWEDVANATAETVEQTMSFEEAAATAYDNVREKVEELCVAYDEAYQAALESFGGQFGLFDEASTKSEEYMDSTVENAQTALDSQLAYWEEYGSNVASLKEYGETLTGEARENYDALVAYAQSGSEEAAGLADSIAQAIADGDDQAITDLANTISEVSAKQEEIAATTADWQTNFTSQMNEYEQEMVGIIQDMDLSDEAETSATATVNSYASAILAGKRGAEAAAKEVAGAVTAALSSANTSVNVRVSSSGSVPGHANGTINAGNVFLAGEEGPELIARSAAAYANGTTDSTDYFIAGENGPELIVGEQGSTVFPTEETNRLINALNTKEQPLYVSAGVGTEKSTGRESASEQVKRILLEISGNGAIEVGGSGGADKDTILDILYEHLKPVLMNIIQSEIYEEGELSYEY